MKISILTQKGGWLMKSGLWIHIARAFGNHKVSWCYLLDDMAQDILRHCYSDELARRDVLFVLHFYSIIPKEKMLLHKNNIVIHAADLPMGRGRSPISWQIEEGRDRIPITLFEMGEKADNGNWYLKDHITLDGTELLDEIREKCVEVECRMIEEFLRRYPMKSQKQKGKPIYFLKRGSECQKLTISSEQFNKMRVADNERYPLWFTHGNKKYFLKIYPENTKHIFGPTMIEPGPDWYG